MSLTMKERGALETVIETMIDDIPRQVAYYRQPEFRKSLQYQNETEFLYGMIIGGIFWSFVNMLPGRLHPEKEIEIHQIIFMRARDIRDAIFATG